MPLLSLALLTAGFGCLLAAWFFSRPAGRKDPDVKLCRGILSKIEKLPASYMLTVSFSSPEGTILHHQEQVQQSTAWYTGMPLLIQLCYKEKNMEVLQVQTFQQAYGKAFVFLLLGMLLIIGGTSLL